MLRLRIVASFLIVTLVSACAQVPEESVTLSAYVGNVLEELREKNSNLVRQLFTDRRQRINEFIDNTYTPYIINDSIDKVYPFETDDKGDTAVTETPLNYLNRLVQEGRDREALAVMRDMVTNWVNRVQMRRSQMLAPIDAQERQVKQAFDSAFGVAIKGTETTTGLLRSVRNVHSVQGQILGKIGMGNLRDTINEKAAESNAKLGKLLTNAQKVNTALDGIITGKAGCADPECMANKIQELMVEATMKEDSAP